MSLSLEVKKFINSEHTGEYIEIELPGEIEVPRPRVKKPKAAPVPEGEEGADAVPEPVDDGPEVQHERARIHYIEAGTGEPLLLIHTIGQSFYTWRKVFNRLSEHYRVIAPDLFGHGYSDRPITFGYSIEEHTDALLRFMDALNIPQAILGGYDWGGRTANVIAALWPQRVSGLVAVSGYIIVNLAANLQPLAPEAELGWW